MGIYTSARAEGTRIGPIVLGPAIGQGGEGIVYLAEHDSLGEVAVKEFFPAQMVSRDSAGVAQPSNTAWQSHYRKGVKQFVELGRKLVKLDPHQNIIRFHDVIELEGMACLVMQLVMGHSLYESMEQGKFEDPAQILALADSLSSALEHLHAAQVHHRDIAPDNVLIRHSDGRVYLVDFNAAKDLVMEISQSRETLVKAGYSPVEQYWGEGDQAATVDIYAASAVLYHAITGRKPIEAVRRLDQDTLPAITTLAAGQFPPSFLMAIERGLAIKAGDRTQSMREWREMLGFGGQRGFGGFTSVDARQQDRGTEAKTVAPNVKVAGSSGDHQTGGIKIGIRFAITLFVIFGSVLATLLPFMWATEGVTSSSPDRIAYFATILAGMRAGTYAMLSYTTFSDRSQNPPINGPLRVRREGENMLLSLPLYLAIGAVFFSMSGNVLSLLAASFLFGIFDRPWMALTSRPGSNLRAINILLTTVCSIAIVINGDVQFSFRNQILVGLAIAISFVPMIFFGIGKNSSYMPNTYFTKVQILHRLAASFILIGVIAMSLHKY